MMLHTISLKANMRALHVLATIAGLVGLTTVPAPAQLQDSVSRVGAALVLQLGNRIRVHTQAQGWVEGRLRSTSSSLAILRVGEGQTEIPMAGVDSVFVRQSHVGEGALVGLVVGGLGLGLWAASNTDNPSPNCVENCFTKGGSFALGALLGGHGGTVVGALIGAASPKLQRLVP